MRKLLNFIDGRFKEPTKGAYLESFNPSTGEPHVLVADSDESDVKMAVCSARGAFAAWSGLKAADRAKFLYKIADLIDSRTDELARAESSDQGKPFWLAKSMDIPRAAHNFRFFAGAILHQEEEATRIDQGTFNYVTRHPMGVAGLISPWNLPLYLLTWKIAPAIAYGNTCVAKPSEITSLTANLLCEIIADAGIPPGVVNMVFGLGGKAGAALVANPKVPLVSFTGGTATGKAIATATAPLLKKLSLELGGKNPNIVFDDANLEEAVAGSIRSSFLNQGQICLCGSRIYVQEKIYERFLEQFVAKAKALKVGDPLEEDTFLGPVVSKEHHAKIMGFLDLAREEKAQFLTGGSQPNLPGKLANGYFLEPTILAGVKSESKLQLDEIFGPVVTVTPFSTEEEAIRHANSVSYGLSASIWTQSLKRAHGVAEKVEAGTVWVNTWMLRDLRMPFGGVKASGLGREGQNHSLEFFTEAKTICVRY